MSWPAHSTRPEVGRLLPVMSSKSVVLPEPLGPSTPTMAGASTRKSASSVKVGVRASAARVDLAEVLDAQHRQAASSGGATPRRRAARPRAR
jgi:hypothetical protein